MQLQARAPCCADLMQAWALWVAACAWCSLASPAGADNQLVYRCAALCCDVL